MERFQTQWLEANGLRFHARAAGPDDGPPVLLLHGFPEFWYGFHRQLDSLGSAGFRAIAPDQRGYNLSDRPRGVRHYGLDRLTEDLIGWLDFLELADVHLVGHDWGGVVAWWAAVRFPDRVRSLAVLNAPHPTVMRRQMIRDPRQRRKSRYIFTFQLPWWPERTLARNDFALAERALVGSSRPGTFDRATLEAYRRAWARPGALKAMVHWYRAILRHPPAPVENPIVAAPTRILWGLRDRFLGPELIEPSLALCRRGTVERFPDASHWLQHEEPESVHRSLLQLFREAT